MALETPEEIKKAVKERYDQKKDLHDRYESDFGLWRLTEYQLGNKGEYDLYTSNKPRTSAGQVVELLANAKKQIRIPLEKESEEERKQLANAERFVYGALNLADSRLQNTIQPSTQELFAFYSALRGSFATRAFIHKNKNGKTIPDVVVWDPLHITWDVGADDILWVCHTRHISQSQAKAEYNLEIGKKGATLHDLWDDKFNRIIIGDEFAQPPLEHGLKHIPVLISMVGSVPFIQSEKYQDTIKDIGESIYVANRNLFEPRNKVMSYLTTIVGQGVHTPLATYTEDGHNPLEQSPYYKGSQIALKTGDRIEPAWAPTMPKDAASLLAIVTRELTEGGISPVLQGLPEFGVSGYQTQLLTHAASSILLPRQRAIERAYEWLARELLTQYAGGGFEKLRLHGRDGSNEYFDIELSPKDVKGDWFPEVTLMTILPEDMAAKYAMAQVAVQNRLLSRETAMDKLLGIQDTDLEMGKMFKEEGMDIFAIKVRKITATLIEEGRPDLAEALLAEIAQGGMGEKPKPKQKERPIHPEYATGMSPSVLPPEEMGRTAETEGLEV